MRPESDVVFDFTYSSAILKSSLIDSKEDLCLGMETDTSQTGVVRMDG